MKKMRGVTLIELMVVLVIVSIIAKVAISSYTGYVKRARRIDAIEVMSSIMLAEERYRSNNLLYGTLAQAWAGVTTSPGGYYSLGISSVTATGYVITATALGTQAADAVNGTSCSSLTLTVASGVITRAPFVCWPT